MEIETKTEIKHNITKEQIIQFVEEVRGVKIEDAILSKNGLRWSKEKKVVKPLENV